MDGNLSILQNEPNKMEKQNYELKLQNYRAEFFYASALLYFENKQFEEAIQCCLISSEKQMFENPLTLLALTYKELDNHEEALKYAHMTIEINPSNEIAHGLLSEFSDSAQASKKTIQSTDKIEKKDIFKRTEQSHNTAIKEDIIPITLTDKILTRGTFEKTHEFEERIKKLNWLNIGFTNRSTNYQVYDADSEIFAFDIELNTYNNFTIEDSELLTTTIEYKISPLEAKKLLEYTIEICAKVTIKNSTISIEDLIMLNSPKGKYYSLMNVFNERKQVKLEQIQNRKYNQLSFFKKLITDKRTL